MSNAILNANANETLAEYQANKNEKLENLIADLADLTEFINIQLLDNQHDAFKAAQIVSEARHFVKQFRLK